MPERSDVNVTGLLAELREGRAGAAERLLPVVYDELRRRARMLMAREAPGNTLQPTALVHEAYLRLVGDADDSWENRRHFYAAAAEAMRRILIEAARSKGRLKRGGDRRRVPLSDVGREMDTPGVDHLALDEALTRLERHDPRKREVVMLRYFAGLPVDEVAAVLQVSPATVDRDWRYARAWLYEAMSGVGSG